MSTTLQLDIPLLLPETGDACDACVNRLIADLEGRDGVKKAHVIASEEGRVAKLCIHYSPDILPLPRIREIVQAVGASMTERFGHALWQVEGIGHQRRARTVGDDAPNIILRHLHRVATCSLTGGIGNGFTLTKIKEQPGDIE